MLPTSTTNMTGLRTIRNGFSLTNESPSARRNISPVNAIGLFFSCSDVEEAAISICNHEMFHDRAERECRQEVESPDDEDDRNQPENEKRGVSRSEENTSELQS